MRYVVYICEKNMLWKLIRELVRCCETPTPLQTWRGKTIELWYFLIISLKMFKSSQIFGDLRWHDAHNAMYIFGIMMPALLLSRQHWRLSLWQPPVALSDGKVGIMITLIVQCFSDIWSTKVHLESSSKWQPSVPPSDHKSWHHGNSAFQSLKYVCSAKVY